MYSSQSILKFFNPEEVVPKKERDKINNQKLDEVAELYGHTYGNYILSCTHKKKYIYIYIYILGIILAGICYMMLLITPFEFTHQQLCLPLEKKYTMKTLNSKISAIN